ncbi:hypothetical protein PCA20602_01276 [Pandoraea capi]|uniref:Integrase n=1 Tax=Pandoraea capi TaxID=2508286 RepID=A0ABY6VUV9_9BURK|nr:hypothetical protein PCA20602_01276 [Pandoraea capi]
MRGEKAKTVRPSYHRRQKKSPDLPGVFDLGHVPGKQGRREETCYD